MTTLYGIANCDKIRAAKKWLDAQQIDYQFHDYRKQGLPADLSDWLNELGWETLINRRSRSWRQLDERQRDIANNQQALALCEATPTLLKRPILVKNGRVLVGFDEADWLR